MMLDDGGGFDAMYDDERLLMGPGPGVCGGGVTGGCRVFEGSAWVAGQQGRAPINAHTGLFLIARRCA